MDSLQVQAVLPAILVVAAIMLIAGWWWLRRSRGNAKVSADQERVDTLIGWPPEATRVLTQPERAAFALLVRALPDYMILAHVPLARFLSVPKRHSYADWLRRLGYQCVDFVVCDMESQVVAVIELQPPASRTSERSRKRLARMTRSLQAAEIPLNVWPEQVLPSPDMVREVIVPRHLAQKARPAVVPNEDLIIPMPAGLVNPFADTTPDTSADEQIRLMEPPPSTWFDDMDSELAPLDQPKR